MEMARRPLALGGCARHRPPMTRYMSPSVPFWSTREGETSLNIPVSRLTLLSTLLAMALLTASFPASALQRTDGDYWVYSLVVVVPGLEVSATGTMRYEFVSQELLVVDDISIPVNVMRTTGSASGSVALIGLSAAVVMEGYVYEGSRDMSTVRSDMTYWANVTWGVGDFSWPVNSASRSVSTYTPALMSGFDPGATALGATWTESVEVQTTTYNTTTGAVESDETSQMSVVYSVHTELETVVAGAGKFESLRITATEGDGDRVVYWWSEEAGVFVKEDTYVEGTSQPVQTLALEEYNDGGSGTSILLFVAIGSVAAAIALVFLALVLVKRRPPRPANPYDSLPLELQPPPP